MVEVLSLMKSLASELEEADKWLPLLLHQAMHDQTKRFVTDTLPSLTRQGAGGKVRPLSEIPERQETASSFKHGPD